jgi:hypothetical protein
MKEVEKSDIVYGKRYLFYRHEDEDRFISIGMLEEIDPIDDEPYYIDTIPYLMRSTDRYGVIYVRHHDREKNCSVNTDVIFELSDDEVLKQIVAEFI